MEGFNKIISFILGLIVVIVFFAVLRNKVNLKSVGQTIAQKTKTSSITPTPTKSQNVVFTNQYSETSSNIPSTGISIVFFPALLAGAFAGASLRRFKK